MLIVDDDGPTRDLLVAALVDEGYDVRAAADGAAALVALESFPAELVLLDMQMPVLDGGGFVTAYRGRNAPHARIVAIAASPRGLAAAHTSGAHAAVAKPFDLGELLALIALQLEQSPN